MPRILISRLSALGDVVCTLPVATFLKKSLPDTHITWAVDPRFAGIVECCASVDEVLKVKPSFKKKTWPQFSEPFDAALDAQGLLKSAIVVACAKSNTKLGYHWQRELSWLFTAAVEPDPTSLHIVDQYVDVARATVVALGGQVNDGPESSVAKTFALKPFPEDVDRMGELVGKSSGYIVLNAGAGWASKRWPPAFFAKVIREANRPCVLIGGKAKADRAAADEVFNECESIGAPRPQDLLGQTSVRELVALIAGCDAHIGGDTGSTHLAAALGRPAIGLYSITRPERSCPYGQRDRCQYSASGLINVTPASVLNALKEVL